MPGLNVMSWSLSLERHGLTLLGEVNIVFKWIQLSERTVHQSLCLLQTSCHQHFGADLSLGNLCGSTAVPVAVYTIGNASAKQARAGRLN